MSLSMQAEIEQQASAPKAVAQAAWHGLFWLVVANAVGVLIAILLLAPGLNPLLGEWTYGRWIMVHMNLELYGWTSIPLVGFLFYAYGADREPFARWCRPVLWTWSAALLVGVFSWLSGQSTGKLFLDWSGYARILFVAALLALWLFLLVVFIVRRRASSPAGLWATSFRLGGLLLLLMVPFVIYAASATGSYPPVNPDSGGPTGSSQLESSLAVVAIVLILPLCIARRSNRASKIVPIAWIVLLAESILCAALSRSDVSHHQPVQFLSLASLLIWLPLTPAYYAAFNWRESTRRWKRAFLWWWTALLVSGWISFLPGVLDHLKFTDGLVGHSFIAMAGFTSSFIIFVTVHLLGDDGWIFNGSRSFYLWNSSVATYAVLMIIAGWYEGFDPAFTVVPGALRNVLYAFRLLSGILMLLASFDWLVDASMLLRRPAAVSAESLQEKIA